MTACTCVCAHACVCMWMRGVGGRGLRMRGGEAGTRQRSVAQIAQPGVPGCHHCANLHKCSGVCHDNSHTRGRPPGATWGASRGPWVPWAHHCSKPHQTWHTHWSGICCHDNSPNRGRPPGATWGASGGPWVPGAHHHFNPHQTWHTHCSGVCCHDTCPIRGHMWPPVAMLGAPRSQVRGPQGPEAHYCSKLHWTWHKHCSGDCHDNSHTMGPCMDPRGHIRAPQTCHKHCSGIWGGGLGGGDCVSVFQPTTVYFWSPGSNYSSGSKWPANSSSVTKNMGGV